VTFALAAAIAVIVLGLAGRCVYLTGYRDGHQDGADDLANAYLDAAARGPDPFDAWPTPHGQVRRPS